MIGSAMLTVRSLGVLSYGGPNLARGVEELRVLAAGLGVSERFGALLRNARFISQRTMHSLVGVLRMLVLGEGGYDPQVAFMARSAMRVMRAQILKGYLEKLRSEQ